MNQEQYPDWYVTFRKWQPRIACVVLVPLIVVGGLLMALSHDGPNSFTFKHGWDSLMQILGWGCFLAGILPSIGFGILTIKMSKVKR